MNRRNFLSRIGIGAAACAVAPILIKNEEDDIVSLGFDRDKLEARLEELNKYPLRYDECYSPEEVIRIWRETKTVIYKK